mmetsp:Transcript_29497/g.87265  ORF Transcript_29497/g.87265 Transcript_29497/m.87265 type:complete len:207 (-) Transcript_29497:294-914(-)
MLLLTCAAKHNSLTGLRGKETFAEMHLYSYCSRLRQHSRVRSQSWHTPAWLPEYGCGRVLDQPVLHRLRQQPTQSTADALAASLADRQQTTADVSVNVSGVNAAGVVEPQDARDDGRGSRAINVAAWPLAVLRPRSAPSQTIGSGDVGRARTAAGSKRRAGGAAATPRAPHAPSFRSDVPEHNLHDGALLCPDLALPWRAIVREHG